MKAQTQFNESLFTDILVDENNNLLDLDDFFNCSNVKNIKKLNKNTYSLMLDNKQLSVIYRKVKSVFTYYILEII